MKSSAMQKNAALSAQKMRLVAGQVRGLPVEKALDCLAFSDKKAAIIMKKVLESAIANAEHNEAADIDELVITEIQVNEGPTAKRTRARAKGRANRILKRSCHVTVTVSESL